MYITLRKKFARGPSQRNHQETQPNIDIALENTKLKEYLRQSKVNQDALELEKDALRAQIKQKEAFSVADKVKVEELNNNLLKAGVEIRESMLKKSSLEKVCKDRFEEIETMKAVTKRFSDELAQNKSEMQKLTI